MIVIHAILYFLCQVSRVSDVKSRAPLLPYVARNIWRGFPLALTNGAEAAVCIKCVLFSSLEWGFRLFVIYFRRWHVDQLGTFPTGSCEQGRKQSVAGCFKYITGEIFLVTYDLFNHKVRNSKRDNRNARLVCFFVQSSCWTLRGVSSWHVESRPIHKDNFCSPQFVKWSAK